jgi:iron complex transport system permease protein
MLVTAMSLVVCPFLGLNRINPFKVFSDEFYSHIFFTIRVPRVLSGFVAGSALALCGMVFQALFRNPLATPFTLGISSGASFGAALIILSGFSGVLLGIPCTQFGAFAGALCAILLVYGFSTVQRTMSNITLLLAGIAISFIFSSLLMFAQYFSNLRNSFQIVRWLMGGLEVYGYYDLLTMLPFVLIGIFFIGIKLHELDHFLTGEDIAKTRGVNVVRTKTILFLATSVTVSAIVSVCGPIGFIDLMIPHLCRLLFGNRHSILGPATLLCGGTVLVVCDTVARTIIAPVEIPVGIITSMLGGPFFLWILFSKVIKGKEIIS